MPMYCVICKHNPEMIPCEYCGNSYIAFQMSPRPSAEEIKTLFQLLDVGSNISEWIGVPCATCGQPFTFVFFNAGGTIIKIADDQWAHDYCCPQISELNR